MLTDDEIRSYRAPAGLLAGRVILVTGASGGLGSALAKACAAAGAQVVLSGRNVRKLEAVYDAIVASGSPRPSIAPLDLERADASHYGALADAVRNEFGRLDGLVHAAAALGERAPIEHYDVVKWLKVMHVNVNAAFIVTQALLPLLRLSQDASVVFTTSGVSAQGRAYWGAYAASKFRAAAYPGEVPDALPAPDQVVGPFLYLLGPESRGVTGRRFDAQ